MIGAASVTTTTAVAYDRGPAGALIVLLEQLRGLLAAMPVDVYRACPVPRLSGSIGEHVRHCLDHVGALASAPVLVDLSYDHRQRGTNVEADPASAVEEIDRLASEIAAFGSGDLKRPITVSSILARGAAAEHSRSTIGRELAFVINHTTHHLAIVALLLDAIGWRCPDGLGVAPSSPTRH